MRVWVVVTFAGLFVASCDAWSSSSSDHATAVPRDPRPSAAPSAPEPTRPLDPWVVVPDARIEIELRSALVRARSENKKVLLEFIANWCTDCREVVRLSALEPAKTVLAERFIVIPVNVGANDRHRSLARAHDVTRLTTLVVLDADGRRIARTTLEPITERQPLSAESLAAWLREASGT